MEMLRKFLVLGVGAFLGLLLLLEVGPVHASLQRTNLLKQRPQGGDADKVAQGGGEAAATKLQAASMVQTREAAKTAAESASSQKEAPATQRELQGPTAEKLASPHDPLQARDEPEDEETAVASDDDASSSSVDEAVGEPDLEESRAVADNGKLAAEKGILSMAETTAREDDDVGEDADVDAADDDREDTPAAEDEDVAGEGESSMLSTKEAHPGEDDDDAGDSPDDGEEDVDGDEDVE